MAVADRAAGAQNQLPVHIGHIFDSGGHIQAVRSAAVGKHSPEIVFVLHILIQHVVGPIPDHFQQNLVGPLVLAGQFIRAAVCIHVPHLVVHAVVVNNHRNTELRPVRKIALQGKQPLADQIFLLNALVIVGGGKIQLPERIQIVQISVCGGGQRIVAAEKGDIVKIASGGAVVCKHSGGIGALVRHHQLNSVVFGQIRLTLPAGHVHNLFGTLLGIPGIEMLVKFIFLDQHGVFPVEGLFLRAEQQLLRALRGLRLLPGYGVRCGAVLRGIGRLFAGNKCRGQRCKRQQYREKRNQSVFHAIKFLSLFFTGSSVTAPQSLRRAERDPNHKFRFHAGPQPYRRG